MTWTEELDIEAREERKARAVQSALMGLPVTYERHRKDGLTPNVAKVNGYSIIWHEYAMGADEPDEVEVRMLSGDCERVLISKLRELVA